MRARPFFRRRGGDTSQCWHEPGGPDTEITVRLKGGKEQPAMASEGKQ